MKLNTNSICLLLLLPLFLFNACSSESDPEEPASDFLKKYDGTVWKSADGIYLTHGLETEYYFKINEGSSAFYEEIWAWDGNGCYTHVQVPLDLNYDMEVIENSGDYLHVRLSEKTKTNDGLPSNVWDYMYHVENDKLTMNVESINNWSGDTNSYVEEYNQVTIDTNILEPVCDI